MIHELFKSNELDPIGAGNIEAISLMFSKLLDGLEIMCLKDSRHFNLCKTKLEEACMYAKKSMISKNMYGGG